MTISKSTLALVVRILATAEKLGLTVERNADNDSTLPENGGFVFVRVDGGTAAMIVPKGHVKWCDSHIDWAGKPGYVQHPGGGGTVICRVDPSKVDLAEYLTALSGATKRDRKSSSKTASESTSELIALLKGMGLKPASQPASQEPVPTDSEDEDGEFSTAS